MFWCHDDEISLEIIEVYAGWVEQELKDFLNIVKKH